MGSREVSKDNEVDLGMRPAAKEVVALAAVDIHDTAALALDVRLQAPSDTPLSSTLLLSWMAAVVMIAFCIFSSCSATC